MENVKIELGGKVYEKMRPTVQDWYNNIDFSEKIKDKNVLLDKEGAEIAIMTVADWFGIDAAEIKESGDLQNIMTAYYNIQRNIVQAFSAAVTEKNGGTPVESKN